MAQNASCLSVRRISALGVSLLVSALAACGDTSDSVPRTTGPNRAKLAQEAAWAPGADAARLREQAVAGVRRRGEQDEMLKLEAQLPGFGGFFIDSAGEVVAWLKPAAGTVAGSANAVAIRALLAAKYGTHANPYVREAMAPASRAQIRDAAYSLSELVAMQYRIAQSPVRIPGYAGVGASLFLNRVKVGFRTASDMPGGLDAIVALGVPRDALIPEVWGETDAASTWTDKVRPTRGGIKIGIAIPGGTSDGSHGYNVRGTDGVDFFLTASHVASYTQPGSTGDTVFQATVAHGAVGVVHANPTWTSNGTGSCSGADYCTDSDVALIRFVPGATGERKIGTSVTEGNGGNVGSQQINNWYPIQAVVSPDFIRQYHNTVHKSGMRTGTTTGFIDLICMNLPVNVSTLGGLSFSLREDCVTRVSFAGWGQGDSGGPVFAREQDGGAYYALGIIVAGQGATTNGICTAGQLCAYVFTPWSQIEGHFARGLNPATAQ